MTLMHSEMPVRPRPQSDEMLLGYILRVAHHNGYQSIQTIRQLFSLKSTVLHSINSNFLRFEELMRELSALVRVDYELLKLNFENEMSGIYHSDRAVQDISTFEVKVCLMCMREQKKMHKNWRLAHITHCHIHQCELTSRCLACEAPLGWKPTLYSHCESCKISWGDIDIETEEIPHYQLIDMQLTTPQRSVYWHHLYKMAALAMRLYDAQLTHFRTFPRDIECPYTLFSFCLRMLGDEVFRQEQLANRVQHWKESGKLKYLSGHFFAPLNAQYQQCSSFISTQSVLPNRYIDIRLFQTKHIRNPRHILAGDKASISYQVDVRTLAKCLHFSITDVTSMVRNGALKTLNQSDMSRDYWFDLMDVDAMIEKLASKSQQGELREKPFNIVTLEEAIKLVRRSKWGVAEILSLIIEGQCQAFIENKEEQLYLSNIRINREQLILAMDDFFQKDKDCVKPSKIETFFYANDIHRVHLIKLINEQSTEPEENGVLSPKKIGRFLERYIVLNRWCKLRKLPIPKAIATLAQQRIFPVIHSNSGKGFYIFERNNDVESLLFGCLTDGVNERIAS